MKSSKIILSAFMAFLSVAISAQKEKQFLDTLSVNCNSLVSLKIATFDSYLLKTDTTLAGILAGLQDNLAKIKDNIPEGNYRIVYQPDKSILIEKLAPVSRFNVAEDTVIPLLLNNECEIKTDHYHLYFYFSELPGMLDKELGTCIAAGIRELPDKNRYARTYHYQVVNGAGKEIYPPSKNGYAWDMMNLSAGIGTAVVKSALVTDIGFELGFNFNKKGILRNSYYLSGNLVYTFADTDREFSLTGFLNAGYRYNLSNDREKTNWLGPEIGFPVYREGDFFKDNMFRFGVRWELGKSVYVTGQLYVNEGFKSAYPGLRIGFWF